MIIILDIRNRLQPNSLWLEENMRQAGFLREEMPLIEKKPTEIDSVGFFHDF
jgi:hypothetical protein